MKRRTKTSLLLGAAALGTVAVIVLATRPRAGTGAGALPGLGAPPPATRDSCLECVDKHLGAALVLIAETRDGYPHRLRAIGHLHEAEDESQEFPELHDAIRQARKRYQQTGQPPDFVALEAITTRLRA